MTAGESQKEPFHVTIPFEYKAGLPFVQVTVNGVKGNFLFDTGAPNVISEELAEKLGVKSLAEAKVNDSGGNSTRGNANVKLDNVEIGGVHFYNTGAIVQNLSGSDIFKCLKFDGVIGANLMRTAFWKIDYQNGEISIASDLNLLDSLDGYTTLTFKQKFTGTPEISIQVNGQTISDLTFDTGSNGHISMPLSKMSDFGDQLESTYSIGATSYGVGGRTQSDTTYYVMTDSITFGEEFFERKIVEFEAHADNIGNEFLQNFDVIMDWQSKQFYLKKRKEYDHERIESIGLGVNLQSGKVFVGYIYKGSDADGKLQLDDEILRLGDNVFEDVSPETICQLLIDRDLVVEDQNQVEIEIKRNGERITFQLDKKKLL